MEGTSGDTRRHAMGDGGDVGFGGEAIDYAAADLPVEIGTETVVSAADGGDDDFEDLGFGGGGDSGNENERRPDEEVIEMIWRNAPTGN
jgi:hypothetical protein